MREVEMKRSTDRMLTTHAGSLPMRSDLSGMLHAQDAGQPYDERVLQKRLASAVAEAVKMQVEHGIDIITDGEQSKTSFITYLSRRLTGIATRPGAVARAVSDRQRQDFPDYFRAQRTAAPGFGRRQFYCVGPLRYTGQEAVQTDLDNLQAAMVSVQAEEAFLPAVAVGTVEHWIANEYYPSDEAFLFALADALHEEYKAISDAGFLLQLYVAAYWQYPSHPHHAGGEADVDRVCRFSRRVSMPTGLRSRRWQSETVVGGSEPTSCLSRTITI
jgi:5-methyltetrahydropteroyltriglutamate--homocysteine methyltransferase